MDTLRMHLLSVLCVIVLSIVFLRGVVVATTPDIGTTFRADAVKIGSISHR